MIQRLDSVWREGLRPGSIQAYGFALVCFLLAMSVRTAVGAFNGEMSPFRTYFPAILVATLVGGRGAGVLVLVLGMIAGWDGMMEPSLALGAPSLPQMEDILFFMLTSAAIVWFAESYRTMLRGEYEAAPKHAALFKGLGARLRKSFAPKAPQTPAEPLKLQQAPEALAEPAPQAKRSSVQTVPATAKARDRIAFTPPAQAVRDLVRQYSNQLYEMFAPLIPRGRTAALVGFGGDDEPAIWLGEQALLSRLGVERVYACTTDNYDREALANALKNGTLLIHGRVFAGESQQVGEFCQRVLSEFTRNKTIVFPQQVTFLDIPNLRQSAAALSNHPDLTLFSGSAVAHHLMKQYFGASAAIRMAPDMSFMLGRQTKVCDPVYDIVWLSRFDREKTLLRKIETLMGLATVHEEEIVLPPSHAAAGGLRGKANGRVALFSFSHDDEAAEIASPPQTGRADPDAIAKVHLERARSILSLGHIAVTDSLQGHVLCLLLDKPHIFLNDDSGKNWDFYDTWTRASALCRFARNPMSAWTMATAAAQKAREWNPRTPAPWIWN